MALDLASFASVRAFADEFSPHPRPARHPRRQRRRDPQGSADHRGRPRDAVPDQPPRPLPADATCSATNSSRALRRGSSSSRPTAHRFTRQGSRLRRPRVDAPQYRVVPHLRPDQADEHPVHARARPSARRHGRHRERGASRASSRVASRATATPASWATSAWCSDDRSRRSPEVGRADVRVRRVVAHARRRHRSVLREVEVGEAVRGGS